MYVERLALSNIKGFTKERKVDLALPARGGWIVLAGRNGSGKTTLLRALALCLAGPSLARTLVPNFSNWLTTGEEFGTVSAWVQRNGRSDRLLRPEPGGGALPKGPYPLTLTWLQSGPRIARSAYTYAVRPELDAVPGTIGERGPWAENPRGWFASGYGPFRRLLGGSPEAQRLMRTAGPLARMASLFTEDASVSESVSWLIDLHLLQLEGRGGAEELLGTVLAVLSDGLLPDRYQIRTVDSAGLWVSARGSKSRFPLAEVSDGYRTMAALVLDLIRQIHAAYGQVRTQPLERGGTAVTAPGVVLIDEIETHLHLSWQRLVGPWLRQHFPNIQFIVTTHSPYVCQAADPDGLIRLPAPHEQHPPEVVEPELYRRIVFGSGDDAAISDLFGLDTPYSPRAEDKRRRLVALESKLYTEGLGGKEATEYKELSQLLLSSLGTRATEIAASLSEAP